MRLDELSGVAAAVRDGVTVAEYAGGLADREQGLACTAATRFQNLAYRRWGGLANGIPVWTPLADLGSATTWHSLGGAVMDDTRVHGGAQGAVDTTGRAHGYDRLLVLDGSVVPGTVGMVNPALTITALAERSIAAYLAGTRQG